MTTKIKQIEEALRFSNTLIKFNLKGQECVQRNGNIKSATTIYSENEQALTYIRALQEQVGVEALREVLNMGHCTYADGTTDYCETDIIKLKEAAQALLDLMGGCDG